MIEAGPAYAKFCAAVHAAAFPSAEAWGADAFAGLLGSPGVRGLIEPGPDGDGSGLVLIRCVSDEAEILTLATRPERRRQGVGRNLLAAALAWAAGAGAVQVFLEVSQVNHPARVLYEAAGFVICGWRPRYYPDGGDALVLRLSLGG